MKAHLTERAIKALEPGPKNIIVYDQAVTGFGVRVTSAGARSFVLTYRIDGRERRLTIGAWPDWSVTAAREEAKRLKREIDQGRDPLGERAETRSAPLVRDLIQRYLAEHASKLSARNASDQASMLRSFVEPVWGSRKVEDIAHEDVDRLLAEVAKGRPRSHHAKGRSKAKRARKKQCGPKPTAIRANRVGEVVRKMFNLAVRWRMRPDNPAQGFARVPEYPRERYLSRDEIERLSRVIADHPNRRAADVIRLLMFTGARRGEVLNARWEQFNLDDGIWTKPAATTKQRRLHRTPISGAAVQLLRTIRPRVPKTCPWVFPGDAPDKPLQEIKRFWDDVRVKAKLEDVRIHDLRHTFASLLVSGGMSLPMIGKLLGHTQVQTTHRYAHLFDDPLRVGLDQVGEMLRTPLKVVGSDAA
jgi:integrase